jgi:hypothetical protein
MEAPARTIGYSPEIVASNSLSFSIGINERTVSFILSTPCAGSEVGRISYSERVVSEQSAAMIT